MIKAKQKENVRWYAYRESYENKVAEICFKTGVAKKTAKSQVYTMIKASLPKVSDSNLYKKIQRARSIYKLFGKIIDLTTKKEVKGIGIDKAYGISYGVRSILELTDSQILNIIDRVTNETRDILTTGQEQNHVTKKSETSEKILPEVNAPSKPQAPSHVSPRNSETSEVVPYDARASYINVSLKEYPYLSLFNSDRHNDGYEFKSSGLCPGCGKKHDKGKVVGRYIKGSYYIKCRSSPNEKEIKINAPSEMISSDMSLANVPSTSQSKPTYDRSYFRNKILDQYPNLYGEFSSENFDYYGITDEKLCPLCKLEHGDEESIEGTYKAGSYFIKCEQREIEMVA